ncbi:type IV pilus assembly protein PilW [Dyella sp. OK004]|uniref:PilW family protein n=1 Tax=Dyella sp. OK004 TaxID=1855292 RepID=UPI0008E251EF|nr:PilW family protein [Dyella sp. OK004]SFS04913.1 type IV pilus assembly protein PilW [Dyella sp. OK004]
MTCKHAFADRCHRQSGLTLIELMVAMVLGLIVAAGVITIFMSTSSSNRAQTQLARLQEEGRFAVTRLKQDLSMANGQYCTNSGGVARPAAASQVYLDGLRTPKVYAKNVIPAIADVTTGWGATSGSNTYPSVPTADYSFPSFLSMRGYECSATACTPDDPHSTVSGIPPMSTNVNDRVKGTDVITVRYVNSSRGWAIGNGGTSIATAASTGAVITSITLAPASSVGEPPASDFASGDMAMLADCSNAQIFAVTKSGTATLTPDSANNFDPPSPQQPLSAPKLFDFNRDYQTVTYYVKVVDNGNGQKTGALMRRVNGGAFKKDGTTPNPGGSEDELVRGVERLDFRYGVQDINGRIRYLTADAVDSATGITCPPGELNAITSAGCLWRAVSSIELNLVIDGQVPLYTLTANELAYTYGIDGKTTPVAPSAHTIKPSDQGFVDPMIRREFTAVVSVRNFNP